MTKTKGRPKLEKQNARNAVLTLRLRTSEIDRIQEVANKEGLTKSNFIRKLLQKFFDEYKRNT